MQAGIAVFELKAGKKVEASRIWKESFVPAVRKQSGFKSAFWLTAPEMDKAISIELWEIDLAASAFESSGLFQQLLEKFRSVLAQPPTREEYAAVQALPQ